MKFLNLLIGIIFFHSLNAFATDRETIRFNIIPEDSFITYTLNTAPPQVEERFDIIEGSFDIDIYTGRCGTRFIKFNSSDFTTIPATLPYGSFNLPTGVEGEFVENSLMLRVQGGAGQYFAGIMILVEQHIACPVQYFPEF